MRKKRIYKTGDSPTNGWFKAGSEFWVLYKDGVWTGMTIAKLTGSWAKRHKPESFPVRFYPQDDPTKDFDIGEAATLDEAKQLAGDHYATVEKSSQ